jgi:DNA end-binding protein Ku
MRSFLLGLLLGTLGAILFHQLRYRLKRELDQEPSRAATATGAGRSTQQSGQRQVAAPDDLSRLTAAELYRRATAAGIPGRSGMSKAQLIAALQAASGQ